MSSLSPDTLNRLTTVQNQIWQTVSMTFSEASGSTVNFANALTVGAQVTDVYPELASPLLIIQFAFADSPQNLQVVLIPQETFVGMASVMKNQDVREVNENLISEVRPALEAIVQGLCVAVGNIRNHPIAASALSIRYQIFSFPGNLQRSTELFKVQVNVSSDGLNGTVIWLLDSETAGVIVGAPAEESDEDSTPFNQLEHAGQWAALPSSEDGGGLDILMDIPLEISVELGRMKMMVKDIVELGTGSIVEIEKSAGEPVDVMVNGRLVARGEVVVIEDNFGVRITEIVTPQERMNRLNEVA